MKKLSSQKLTGGAGLLGAGIILTAASVTAIAYRGSKGEAYCPLNHFISELGQRGVSELAPVFNTGLIAGGICIALFMLGLGLDLKKISVWAASGVGMAAGIACSLVGVFPMNEMTVHVRVALAFFRGGLIAVLMFTLIILFDRRRKISRWMAIPGLVTVLAFSTFLYLPDILEPGSGANLAVPDVRPAFWLNPFLEWLVFFTVLAWILSVSTFLCCSRLGGRS